MSTILFGISCAFNISEVNLWMGHLYFNIYKDTIYPDRLLPVDYHISPLEIVKFENLSIESREIL